MQNSEYENLLKIPIKDYKHFFHNLKIGGGWDDEQLIEAFANQVLLYEEFIKLNKSDVSFMTIISTYKRALNILPKNYEPKKVFDVQDKELELFKKILNTRYNIYISKIISVKRLYDLSIEISSYIDGTMINVEDVNLRETRLAIIHRYKELVKMKVGCLELLNIN